MKPTAGIFACLFAALLPCMPGCARAPAGKPARRMTIAMQEFVGYGLLYLAKEKGFDGEEGVDLVFVDEQLDAARRDAFKRGMLDCEAGTLDLLISKRSQGAPIAAVMELDRSYGADGIVAADGIKTLKDLVGKKVALAKGDVGETLLLYLLRREGLGMDKITVVARGPEDVAKAFLDGQASAAVTWEPFLSKALDRPGSGLIITSKDIPRLIVDTLNVRQDLVTEDPDAVKALMRAWFRALKYYREHPLESSGIISGHYRMSPEEYRRSVEGLVWTDYAEQSDPAGEEGFIELFDKVADLKYSSGLIAEKPSAKDAIIAGLLKDLYRKSR